MVIDLDVWIEQQHQSFSLKNRTKRRLRIANLPWGEVRRPHCTLHHVLGLKSRTNSDLRLWIGNRQTLLRKESYVFSAWTRVSHSTDPDIGLCRSLQSRRSSAIGWKTEPRTAMAVAGRDHRSPVSSSGLLWTHCAQNCWRKCPYADRP